jgi:hypothetical protein
VGHTAILHFRVTTMPDDRPKFHPDPSFAATGPVLRGGAIYKSAVPGAAFWFVPRSEPEPMSEDDAKKLIFLATGPEAYSEMFSERPPAARWLGLPEESEEGETP